MAGRQQTEEGLFPAGGGGGGATRSSAPSPAAYFVLHGGASEEEATDHDDDEVHMRSISGFALFSRAERGDAVVRKALTRRRDVVLSSLGSFSTAYNIVVISLAMVSMSEVYAQSEESKSLSASTMFAGMVCGQLGFGFVGDAVGLPQAFRLTMLLQVAGAIWSALVFPPAVYTQLATARFVLGVGAGGVYPLAAAVASNAAATATGGRSSDRTVALVFSLQGVAFVSMNLLATVLVDAMESRPQAIFRLLLGVGALPGLLILLIEGLSGSSGSRINPSSQGARSKSWPGGAREATNAVLRALRQPKARKRLVGCSLTWFLYDVCFFGNTLFQPAIGTAIFGRNGSLRTESKTSLLIALVALPGYFVAVALIDRLGPRWIQTQGFLLCALLYLVLAFVGDRLIDEGLGGVALLLYGLSFSFFNFGPGATTYLYPSKLFPPEAKSTLNGVAAAAGKIGGFLGGALFPLLEDNLPLVLGLCAGIALVGAGVTLWTLDDGDVAGKHSGPMLDPGEEDNAMVAAGGRPMLDPLSVEVGIEGEGGKMEEQEDEDEQEGRDLNGDTARLMRQRQLLANMAAMSSSASSSSTSLV